MTFRKGDAVYWTGNRDVADLPPIKGTFVEVHEGEARVTLDMTTVLPQHLEAMEGLSPVHSNYTVALDQLAPAEKWPVLACDSA